jgi:[acyl-carrier-protein] S-malonyltransferase
LLRQTDLAFVFPAFLTDYSGEPDPVDVELRQRIDRLLHHPSVTLGFPSLLYPGMHGRDISPGELENQVFSYVYNCALSDLFHERGIFPGLSAGYSMGLYSALYDAGSVGFDEGLSLVIRAYQEIEKASAGKTYGMVSVVGLEETDIRLLATAYGRGVAISNCNNPIAFILSGPRSELEKFSAAAREEGALHVQVMQLAFPYHSAILKPTIPGFRKFVDGLSVRAPGTGICSLVDQSVLNTAQKIRDELIRNLHSPLNWYRTQQAMTDLGISLFVETGAGNYLTKNSKFIPGNYRFLRAMDYTVR